MDCYKQIELIKTGFINNRKLLLAIGDENRQIIMTVLMGQCNGLRVGEITTRTHLSRPAVSHHLKILLDCGLASLNKQGTMNYYSLNLGEEFQNFLALIRYIAEFKQAKDAGLLEGIKK